jgi:hypothetical protein
MEGKNNPDETRMYAPFLEIDSPQSQRNWGLRVISLEIF